MDYELALLDLISRADSTGKETPTSSTVLTQQTATLEPAKALVHSSQCTAQGKSWRSVASLALIENMCQFCTLLAILCLRFKRATRLSTILWAMGLSRKPNFWVRIIWVLLSVNREFHDMSKKMSCATTVIMKVSETISEIDRVLNEMLYA